MGMDSDSVVNNVLREENALRLLGEKKSEGDEDAPVAADEGKAVAAASSTDRDLTSAADSAAEPDEPSEFDEAAAARASQASQMEEMDQMGQIAGPQEGRIVEGVVVHIDSDGVLVDVGAKSEGAIRAQEFARGELEELKVGDRISVFVVRSDDEEESIQLSKKKADYEISWQRILRCFESGEIVQCAVTDRVKGGLRVDLGIMGFIPASHVGVRNPNDLDRFVGEVVNAKIIEVDRNRKKVILSRRIAEKEVRESRKSTIMSELREGQVREGEVRNITNYGAFVDLGGVDGLLHVTEMSWVHVNRPEEVLKPGDKIRVMVLKIDKERERISLGLKQLLPDPWDQVARNYHVGKTITVTVSRCVASGAFVKLPEGVEAFIPIGEMSDTRINRPEDVIQPGQTVEAKVISLQARQRRMSLSLVQAASERYVAEAAASQEPGNVTIGDQFGHLLQQAVGPREEEEAPGERPEDA